MNDEPDEETEDLKKTLLQKRNKASFAPEELLHSGSTMLNLAATGNPNGAFPKGTYIYIVGDSSSGKTFLSLTCMAEAAINKNFKDYRFIFDNVENGALMDVERFFGKAVQKRMEPPGGSRSEPVYSQTVQQFFYHVDDALNEGLPFIYLLDSMDGLDTDEDVEKFEAQKQAYEKGKEEAGSFGVSKAKALSSGLRRIVTKLEASGSILIIISQTRDKIGFGSQFDPKTRAGGRALRFYCHLEFWSSIVQKLKRKVLGKDRPIGAVIELIVKKNRLNGWEGKVTTPIYRSHGIDDVGGMVDYLIEEGHWELAKAKKEGVAVKGVKAKTEKAETAIIAPEFDFTGKKENLIQKIQEEGLEKDLQMIVSDLWASIEAACAVTRKNKYS